MEESYLQKKEGLNMYKNKKRHSSNQGLTKTQLQRFMSLVALNNNVSPLLQKYVVTDLINGKFIEFVDCLLYTSPSPRD